MNSLFLIVTKFIRPLFLGAVFVLYLFLGFSLVQDYGLSWDEVFISNHGHHIWTALLDHGPSLNTHDSSYNGYLIPMFFSGVDRWFGFADVRQLYQFKHLLSFLIFSLGVAYFYRCSRSIFRSPHVAFALSLFLVFTPRLFGHSFFNPKDTPFLAFFIVSFFYLRETLKAPTLKNIGLFSFFSAISINIRVLGLILWGLYGLGVLLQKKSIKSVLSLSGTVIGLSYVFLYLMWPILWDNPLNLLYAFSHLVNYPWIGDVLFFGKLISSHQLPWTYIFVWIGITTPLLYLLCSGVGICLTFSSPIIPKKYRSSMSFSDRVLILTWVFLPLFMVILLQFTLYDGWRHVYFIFPGLLLMSGVFLELFFHTGTVKPGYRWIVFLLCLFPIVRSMYKLHPYEQFYFNTLAGDRATLSQRFDVDYLGTSYFSLYESILKNDSSNDLTIAVATYPGYATLVLLPKHERERIRFVRNPKDADYFLTHFRWHPHDYAYGEPIYKVERDGIVVASAYKTPSVPLDKGM